MATTLLALSTGLSAYGLPNGATLKPRLVVCTDIAPADVEPDDMESMVHLMAYADMFEIEALITSVGWNCDPYPKEWAQYLHRVIDAYEKDVTNLMKRSNQRSFLSIKKENGRQQIGYWPSAEYLRSRAVMGSRRGGIKVIGEGNDSPGSQLLIRLADEDDPRPIYVAAWGGANTLAQAIWRVKQTRTEDELKKFVRKFRIYTITDQDMQYNMRMDRAYSSHMWLRQEFQDDLQFIWDEGTWQEQCELGKQHWTQHQQYIQTKGALGKEYPNYKWGVEGDTPSFLYVLPNGLNDPEDPLQAGWAGYHERGLCPDSLTTAWTSWLEPVRGISVGYKQRFYIDELNDFIARMQWADEGKGNRNPVVVVNGHKGPSPLVLKVKAGETIRLDASRSTDPDGDAIHFQWWQQKEIGTVELSIDNAESSMVNVCIPADAAGQKLHLVCEISDRGAFHLKSYIRIIIDTEVEGGLGQPSDIVADGETPVRVSDSYSFTEGPAADARGNVFFTDQPNNRIYRWDCETGEITMFTNQSGRSNGLYFDAQGNLIACADMDNQLWSFDTEGHPTILITDFGGRLLNGPNDVWISKNGGYYLTDPYFQRDYWTRNPERQQPVEGLYYLAPGDHQLVMLDSTLNQPNGLVGTPDGKHLYVAEAKANRILRYDIQPNGRLTNRQVFADMGSDGMTIDDRGNIYLTGDGVTVFDKDGHKIVHIPIPENWTANVCFGGKERNILFITASKSVYTLKMLVHGVK